MLNNSEITNQLRITKTIYSSIFIGMLLFLAVVFLIMPVNKTEGGNDLDNIFTVIVPLFGLMIMFTSRMVYNKMIASYSTETDLVKKIMRYRTAKIISWAMVEAACLFALIATVLTSNYLYVVVVIFLFGYYFMLKPSRESLICDMRLNSEESEIILKN
ncbi:MAG: hypothetical protein OQJ93_14675 [Ignavibacteriaceae bacterium]|nr:hypothetical protein [Ignavibacteriaceae bacterium]